MRVVPVAEAKARLEASALYLRREQESAATHVMAQAKAAWYVDPKFRPRWEDK